MNDGRPVVVFAGGGTGGHLYPALTLAEALVAQRPDVELRFVGALGGIESRILPERGLPHLLVRVEGLRRGKRFANIRVAFGLVAAVAQLVRAYRRWKPRLVVGTGGYAAAPAGLAAALLRVPLALQEQNSLPGMTTRLLSRFADQIHVAYPEAQALLPRSVGSAIRINGNPIRPLDRVPREEGRRRFGLGETSVVVLITGGSQGSAALNDRLLDAVESAARGSGSGPARMELLWMTGRSRYAEVRGRLDAIGSLPWVHAVPYIEDMPAALAAADLALGRAGAMSTAEFVASALPSVLIPLPTSAEDHQTKNALALERAGVAVCLREAETTGQELWRVLSGLAEDSDRRAAMAARAESSGEARRRGMYRARSRGPSSAGFGRRSGDRLVTMGSSGFAPGTAVHFVGVGGAGMCALAEAMTRAGLRVTGSDAAPGPSVEALRELGVEVWQGHEGHFVDGADVVVTTAAVGADNPERLAAEAAGIPVVKRAEALARWVGRGRVVAIAGTHGKTSTTTLTTQVLAAGGLDPTGFVGGRVAAWGGNFRPGREDLFVVEADEFDRSFLHLEPDVAVVTNVEADHLDTYGSIADVRDAFGAFLQGRRDGSTIVACGDDAGSGRLVQGFMGVVTYGVNPGSQIRAIDVEADGMTSRFRVLDHGVDRGSFGLGVPGLHNVRNALGAAAAARALDVEWEAIRAGLDEYRGVGRRFERLGEPGGILVVDDYAHHPTEVRVTLEAGRRAFPARTQVAVFQPHLFTRTRDFYEEFGRALARADRVWITDIYPAREAAIPGVSAELVVQAVRTAGLRDVQYHADLDTLPEALARTLVPGDVCITLGAGSIEGVGPSLVALIEEES